MAKNTVQYVTKEGERWDTISFKAYGVISEVHRIMEANPNVPVTPRLKGGMVIELPIINGFQPSIDPWQLPPWKR
ncbi:MAG: tail protein X [Bacteroidales bacterium]|nr:tail protein X [Bacteroidales bacterium]